MHSFMLVRHGHVIAEGWWKPESADKPHVLWSLSKSFNSTAVGLAIEEGKLSLDDPVLKFFPDDAPADPSDNLKAMSVRDLLTMTGGHDTEPKFNVDAGPSVKEFLAHPVPHKPGTHFHYNTPGSYTLSAIVTKATGQTVLDYLKPRLFEPLGIDNPAWDASPEGYSLRRLRPEAPHGRHRQVRPALSAKRKVERQTTDPREMGRTGHDQTSDNDKGPSAKTADWQQGYGFQFWRCHHNAFRGDGRDGQFCIVMPEQDAVIAITADTSDMQGGNQRRLGQTAAGVPYRAPASGRRRIGEVEDGTKRVGSASAKRHEVMWAQQVLAPAIEPRDDFLKSL